MFIWQRALGLCYYLECFATGNTFPSYIFIFTASNAKKRKGAVIRQLAFTFSSASHLTLKPSHLQAWEMRNSVIPHLCGFGFQLPTGLNGSATQAKRDGPVAFKNEKKNCRNGANFSFLSSLCHSDLWEAEAEALTGERAVTSVSWPG